MKHLALALITTASLFINASSLYADEEETTQEDASCQVECPEGQSRVSFADGGRVSCVCSDATSGMVETPEVTAPCTDANDDGQCD